VTDQRDLLARRTMKRLVAALVVSLTAAMPVWLRAQTQAEPRFLAKEQIVFYGIGLKVEPAH
jgi:hypothetical protein